MARVKGTILVDFVKTIRADKTGKYERHLTEGDREIISERILPSNWYPMDTFRNCFNAVVSELAGNDMARVRDWGRIYGESLITGVYRGIIKPGQPMTSLQRYGTHIRNFFDFGEVLVDPLGDNSARVTVRELDRDFESLHHMMNGWLERSLELCGARDVESKLVQTAWNGADCTMFDLAWSIE